MNNKVELHILTLVNAGIEQLNEAHKVATFQSQDRLLRSAEAYEGCAQLLFSAHGHLLKSDFKDNETWMAFRKRLRKGT